MIFPREVRMTLMIEVLEITIRSILISTLATILSASWSIPLSFILSKSRGRSTIAFMGVMNALIGFPTVLVGLFLYIMFSSTGPLGFLSLLYTPTAIMIGEAILITPLIISLSYEEFNRAYIEYWETSVTLGATETQAFTKLLNETSEKIVMILLIAFSRAIGELGVALMVGGNIRGFTRVFTTAIALEVSKGNFELALFLGLILLIIVSTTTAIIRILGGKGSD